ncbi:PH domain-containing protein [Thermosyntropha sp.]|uniref:PH domain-containing protein n=1 Tax=Thermosyntropha sp. TaxID=2740820 RepID=UPI0025CE59D2|nr:PH domain-containing protein [Thermosyntropha sp.]MBO8158422.1 hypothetical protein [Thermosyntropha sp.]
MNFNVNKTAGFYLGSIAGFLILGFCIWGINFSLGNDDQTLKTMLLIPAFIFLGIFIVVVLSGLFMGYSMDDNGIQIRWGFRKKYIMWNEIEHIIKVEGRSNFFSIFGISWPGYVVGLYNIKGLGPVRMYATHPEKGFLYLKTSKGFYGITPRNVAETAKFIGEKAAKNIEYFDMNEMPEEVKGKIATEDRSYRLLYTLNIILLLTYALYLALFFPGTGASKFIILLLVLAIGLFFFNTSNASRLFQFSPNGGYTLLILGIIVTGTFFILSLVEITL